jgi:hypothetical protein
MTDRSITYDKQMFENTAVEIEKSDPIIWYTPRVNGYDNGPMRALSGRDESRYVHPQDLTLAQLENPAVDGLVPNSSGKEAARATNEPNPTEALGRQIPLWDPDSQFNRNTEVFWDGEGECETPNHPAVKDFLCKYSEFQSTFYDAHWAMIDELRETAANVRRMATIYQETEDVNQRDVFSIPLPPMISPTKKVKAQKAKDAQPSK